MTVHDPYRPLRVAILARAVYPIHGYGGLERHVGDLVQHLLRREVAVTLITRPPVAGISAAALDTLQKPNLRIRWVPYTTFPFAGRRWTTVVDRSTAYVLFGRRAGRAAARLVAAGELDVVHALGASGLGYARHKQRRGVAVPLILNPQGLEEFGGAGGRVGASALKRLAYRPLQAAVRATAQAADRVIATDRALQSAVVGYLHVPPDRVRVVPNAIDLEWCDRLAGPTEGTALRSAHGWSHDDPPVLLSVGRLEENKGFHLLIRALASLHDLNWRWVLVGAGPLRARLVQELTALGLGSRVLLTGQVDDQELHAWYEAASLFVHPTLYEGSSLVTLEAMAHRRAVVGTTAGGLPDKVHDDLTGWLVEPGDAAALAGALRTALASRARLAGMGAAGRALAEREFSWPSITTRLISVFREVVSETAGKSAAPSQRRRQSQ